MTFVMTVPGSGTHFLIHYLVAVLGLDGKMGGVTPKTNCDFFHLHPSTAAFDEIRPSEFCDTVIITLRHPHKSLESGKWRGAAKAEHIANAWESLLEEQKNYKKTLFLVIDGPEEDRFPQLMAIAEHFGKGHMEDAIREYAEEWTPRNSTLTENDRNAVEFATRAYEQWR